MGADVNRICGDETAFDPDDTGFAFIRWKYAGQPCRHDVSSIPGKRKRCSKPLAVETLLRMPVGPLNGPQGVYVCEDGHRGWIWLRDCEDAT